MMPLQSNHKDEKLQGIILNESKSFRGRKNNICLFYLCSKLITSFEFRSQLDFLCLNLALILIMELLKGIEIQKLYHSLDLELRNGLA